MSLAYISTKLRVSLEKKNNIDQRIPREYIRVVLSLSFKRDTSQRETCDIDNVIKILDPRI